MFEMRLNMSTHKNIDHIAGKLLRTSPNPDVRAIAAAALSDTNPPAHTRNRVASIAAELMHAPSKQVRSVAASVLADHKNAG